MAESAPLNLRIPDASPGRIRALDIDAILAKADPPVVGWFQFPVAERLREIEAAGGRPEDQALLALLHIAVGFMLQDDDPKNPFRPLFVMTNGARSSLPGDLDDAHFEALARMREVVKNVELKARISDVLWQRKHRKPEDAKAAVTAYLACAEPPGISWVERHQRIKRAFQLALAVGRGDPELFATVDAKLLEHVRTPNAEAGYYGERLLRLLLQTNRTHDEQQEFAELAVRGGRRAMAEGDPNRAHAFFETASKWFDKRGAADKSRDSRIMAAEATVADALSQPQAIARASMLADAVKELRNAGASAERIDHIRRTLDETQHQSIKEMASISVPIDVTEPAQRAKAAATGLPFCDALRRLALRFSVPRMGSLRAEAHKLLRDYPLSQGLGGRQLAAGGRVTGIVEPLIGIDDEEALLARMRDGSNRYWQMAVVSNVIPFLEQTRLEHAPTIEDFIDLVAPKPFVPPGRESMFALGLHAGFYGEWFESVHILVPQVENALRWLLESLGEIVYGQYASGVQDYMKLEQVLAHPKLRQILESDLIFDLEGLLCNRLGGNLRNRLAHGLLEWSSGDENHAVYLWWLVLHLAFKLRYADGSSATNNVESPSS